MQTEPVDDSISRSGISMASSRSVPAVLRRTPEQEPTDYWSYELFGCLSDWRLCCATFFCPCYTLGRNAAYFGDDGAKAGFFYGLGLFAVCASVSG